MSRLPRPVTPRPAATVALALALVMAGCAGDTDADPTPTGDATAGSTVTATTPVEPTADPSTSADLGEPGDEPTSLESDGPSDPSGPAFAGIDVTLQETSSGGPLTVSGVRTGVHEVFERIVFDIEGDGQPGWFIRWDAVPTGQAQDDPIDMPGSAFLWVLVEGIEVPTGGDGDTIQTERIPVGGLRFVQAIHNDNWFEGQQGFHLGTPRATPFRTFLLSDPTRLVVDISTE